MQCLESGAELNFYVILDTKYMQVISEIYTVTSQPICLLKKQSLTEQNITSRTQTAYLKWKNITNPKPKQTYDLINDKQAQKYCQIRTILAKMLLQQHSTFSCKTFVARQKISQFTTKEEFPPQNGQNDVHTISMNAQ